MSDQLAVCEDCWRQHDSLTGVVGGNCARCGKPCIGKLPQPGQQKDQEFVRVPVELFELIKQDLIESFEIIDGEFGDSKCLHGNRIWLEMGERCKALCKCGHDCSSHIPIHDHKFSLCTAPGCICLFSEHTEDATPRTLAEQFDRIKGHK